MAYSSDERAENPGGRAEHGNERLNDEHPLVVEQVGDETIVAWPLLFRERLTRGKETGDGQSPWLVLWTVLAGLFASGFSITIIAVSLGDIADDLGTTTQLLTWAVTGPFLALALTMPLFGKLGDIYGHRRVYIIGLAGFTLATLLTALAWSGPALVLVRTLGAIPGAATGPASMALIMRAFPDHDRVKAMGWWSLVGSGAPVIGLVVGGPIVDAIGWRGIFVLQTPIAAAALLLAIVVLRETPRRDDERIDWLGAVTLASATVSFLLALNLGGSEGWSSPIVIGLFVAAPIAFYAFLRVERSAPEPLVPLWLFTRRTFSASLAAQFCTNFAYMGGFIVTPLFVQGIFGFSVAQASLAMVCRPLSFSVSAPAGGYVAVRVGERRSAVTGVSLLVLSMGCFVVAATSETLALVFVGLVLSGLALGLSQPSLITEAANTVEPERLGIANAVQQMAAQIGAVTGIQVLSTIVGVGATGADFATGYAVGAAVAVLGVAAATFLPASRARAAVLGTSLRP
jgi:EmrB/QacA subfamily drug resistance transporter